MKKHSVGFFQKPKLDNAEELRGIYFIDLDDMEFKDTMKNARTKLESSMDSAMSCKVQTLVTEKLVAKTNLILADQRTHESWKPMNLRESAAGKGFNALSHYNLVHKFHSYGPRNENPGCESRWGQRVGQARKIASMANGQIEEQNRDHPRGTEGAKNRTLCIVNGPLSSQKCGVGASTSEIQRPSRTPRRHRER